MSAKFPVEIVTPERTFFKGEVDSLIVPAYEGYMGILRLRAPLLAMLQPGEITVTHDRVAEHFACDGGFVEVSPKKVIVLADGVSKAGEIDLKAVEKMRKAALEQIASRKNVDEAKRSLEICKNRQKLAEKYKR